MINTFPYVPGSDVAGEVHEVGSNVKSFKKGDRVVGQAQALVTGKPEDGAFSLYSRVSSKTATIIPSNVSFKDASVLPMAIGTASCGVNGEKYLGQPWPTSNPTSSGKVVVVYGGSSSIGSMALQLGTAAGVRMIAIASPKNFDFCRKCGASDVFDQKDTNLVENIVKAVGKDSFVGIFDAIASEECYKIDLAVLEKLGGGSLATSHPPPESLPSNVKGQWILGPGDHSAPVWENFVTKALESGQLKCLPEPLVVGKGLESLQGALEKQKGGVSAQKLVVEL